MNNLEKAKARADRAEAQALWRGQLDQLPINDTEFCERNDFDKTVLSRYINGRMLAREDWFNRITAAFAKEAECWGVVYTTPE
jgi:hypothetical protein